MYNATPEDHSNLNGTRFPRPGGVPGDVVSFVFFMRFLAPPQPSRAPVGLGDRLFFPHDGHAIDIHYGVRRESRNRLGSVKPGQPSRTAMAAAAHRAAHQVLEAGRIFRDPLALRILGADADTIAREAETDPSRRRMRIFIAARTRFAEDALAAAVGRGVSQVVVLGAGLDTFAYRSALREGMRIFEVDHPATQEWKREQLASAGIPVPDSLTFAPVDFESSTIAVGLAAAGFDSGLQTFFTWLGVVPYLPEPSVWSILAFIGNLPGGAHVAFDYANPSDSLSPESRAAHDRRASRVAELGEPWLSYFDTGELHTKLREYRFHEIEDLGPPQIAARYFPDRVSSAPPNGGHIVRASRLPELLNPA
jgi:methyltransferase (TIGR00027 family)